MDFGQTLDPLELKNLKMTLPGLDSVEELQQIERLKRAAARSQVKPQIFIGAPIWSHAPWVGNFYPETSSSADFLREYSKQLNTVEVNSTFYAIPSSDTFAKWKESVGEGFRFCPKFPKSVSHSLDGNHPDLKTFTDRVLGLESKLGVTFLQLPQYFAYREQDRLKQLLSKISRELKVVVEIRNQEYFSQQRLKPDVVEMLAHSFAGAVSVDAPLERNVAHVSLTSTRAMIRFLGANLHESDEVRLKEWAKRIAIWFKSGLKEVYFLLHEPDNSLSPQASELMIRLINAELKEQGIDYQLPAIVWNQLL